MGSIVIAHVHPSVSLSLDISETAHKFFPEILHEVSGPLIVVNKVEKVIGLEFGRKKINLGIKED